MLLRLLLGLGGPLFKLLGVTALEQAMAELKKAFDEIEARLATVERELAEVTRRNDSVFNGWELMEKARKAGPHAPAADPPLPGEDSAARARRLFPEAAAKVDEKRKAANVETEDPDEEMPESHV